MRKGKRNEVTAEIKNKKTLDKQKNKCYNKLVKIKKKK